MAIDTSNINTATVKNALVEDQNAVYHLVSSPNINKWSKYKPVQGTWPQANGYYGFNLPTNWNYNAVSSTGRLGDFRGYEHNQTLTYPPLQCRSSENDIPSTIYPVPPEPGVSPYRAWFAIRWLNSIDSVRTSLTEMGMGSYYYGIKIDVGGGGTPWYKTFGQISGDNSTSFSVDCTLVTWNGAPYFYNLPYGRGTYYWTIFVSQYQYSSWTQNTPSSFIPFPSEVLNGINFVTSGTFNVAGWVYASDDTFSFTRYGGLLNDRSTITFIDDGAWSIQSKPSWITVSCWDGVQQLNNPSLWRSGTDLRMDAEQNYGSYRTGTVVVSAAGATTNISVEQAAAPVGVTYIWTVGNQESFTISNYTHGMSVSSTSFDLAFDHTFVGDSYKPWSITKSGYGLLASGSGNPGGVRLRTGIQGVKGGTLSQAIADGDTIYIMIGLNAED